MCIFAFEIRRHVSRIYHQKISCPCRQPMTCISSLICNKEMHLCFFFQTKNYRNKNRKIDLENRYYLVCFFCFFELQHPPPIDNAAFLSETHAPYVCPGVRVLR
eukprot:GEMP01115842.1.p2 GENE.GEMP01115842.1~~GEMP01115842.1.p2  ORF type:complete len:104 (+),score=2.59 GEMP01115842.1:216-527(+)